MKVDPFEKDFKSEIENLISLTFKDRETVIRELKKAHGNPDVAFHHLSKDIITIEKPSPPKPLEKYIIKDRFEV